MKGLRSKMKQKALKKASDKLNKSTPMLMNFAVNNDIAYEKLMQTIIHINNERKKRRKKVYEISSR